MPNPVPQPPRKNEVGQNSILWPLSPSFHEREWQAPEKYPSILEVSFFKLEGYRKRTIPSRGKGLFRKGVSKHRVKSSLLRRR